MFGWLSPNEMDDGSRRTVKAVVFGLCYGGGAGTLSNQAGITQELAQDIINAFYARYPGVELWHDNIVYEAKKGTKESKEVGSLGGFIPVTRVTTLITGREHVIMGTESPEWLYKRTGEVYSIPPTKIKNYKPQGFAGGDVVMVLGVPNE